MDVMRFASLLFPVLCMLGCASISTPENAPDISPPQVNKLAPRNLAPGECGLFVWTADAQKRFILFSQSSKKAGAWLDSGNEVPLVITAESGDPANGQYPDVVYRNSEQAAMDLSLTGRESIDDGTRFKAGTLKFEDVDGWERVLPVVGLSACQAESGKTGF